MNTRFKLVAALGLALATGFAGVASAQTPTDTTPAIGQTATGMTAPATAKAPVMKKAPLQSHRVMHRTMKKGKVSRRVTKHRSAKASLPRKHRSAKAGLARKHVAKAKGFYARHAMNRTTKQTVIR